MMRSRSKALRSSTSGDRHLGALGAVELGIRVDGADAPLDGVELVRGHEVGLVEDDHVRERDLVLGLGASLRRSESHLASRP
jgi:hypothetical protein